MSQDDTTTKLPDETKYDTKPGITAVLERINELGEQLNKKIDDSINELRTEMNQRFTQVDDQLSTINAKLDILNEDLLEVKAQQRKQGRRVDDLERKAS